MLVNSMASTFRSLLHVPVSILPSPSESMQSKNPFSSASLNLSTMTFFSDSLNHVFIIRSVPRSRRLLPFVSSLRFPYPSTRRPCR